MSEPKSIEEVPNWVIVNALRCPIEAQISIVSKLLQHLDRDQRIKALSMSGVSDLVRDWIEKNQRQAWDKMGDTGNDEYQEKLNQENYWFGYFRSLEDFESEFLKSTDG